MRWLEWVLFVAVTLYVIALAMLMFDANRTMLTGVLIGYPAGALVVRLFATSRNPGRNDRNPFR